MNQINRFLKRAASTAFAAILVTLTAMPTANAGFLSGVLERVAEHQVSKKIEERIERSGEPSRPSSSAPSVSVPPAGSFSACQQVFPRPGALDVSRVDRQWRPTALCSSHFAVLYSGLTKTPLVVAERLSRDQMTEALDEKRTDQFYADVRLPRGARAELDDFKGSGFDRGHMSPAADQPDQASMVQSFALSNMIPQDPFNNRKTWAKIESDVRKYVRRAKGNVFVFSGPVFRGEQRTIGRGRVWVPSHLFKLVYDEASGRSWAYILANTAEARVEAPVDYAEFVRQTGWQLL